MRLNFRPPIALQPRLVVPKAASVHLRHLGLLHRRIQIHLSCQSRIISRHVHTDTIDHNCIETRKVAIEINWVVSWPVAFEKSTEKPHILPTTSSRNRVHKSEAKLYTMSSVQLDDAWQLDGLQSNFYVLRVKMQQDSVAVRHDVGSFESTNVWLPGRGRSRKHIASRDLSVFFYCEVAKLIKGPRKHEKTKWNVVALFTYPGHLGLDLEQNLPLHSSMQNCRNNCLVNENVHA